MSVNALLEQFSSTDPNIPFTSLRETVPPGEKKNIGILQQYLGVAKTIRIKNDSSVVISYKKGIYQPTETVSAQTSETLPEWTTFIQIDNTAGTQEVAVTLEVVKLSWLRGNAP